MRRQLVPGPVVCLTVIKAKTRPGIEANVIRDVEEKINRSGVNKLCFDHTHQHLRYNSISVRIKCYAFAGTCACIIVRMVVCIHDFFLVLFRFSSECLVLVWIAGLLSLLYRSEGLPCLVGCMTQ